MRSILTGRRPQGPGRRSAAAAAGTAAAVALLAAAAPAQEPAQPAPSQGQPPAACADEVHRQFDFWIGSWEVRAGDRLAGTNRIEKILDGCVLLESWTGANGGSGRSFNYVDTTTGEWVQLWVDGRGGHILARGGLRDGSMHFEGNHVHGDGHVEPFRMTFTPQDGGRVRQFIEQSKDGGDTWYVWFDGMYIPRGARAPQTAPAP